MGKGGFANETVFSHSKLSSTISTKKQFSFSIRFLNSTYSREKRKKENNLKEVPGIENRVEMEIGSLRLK